MPYQSTQTNEERFWSRVNKSGRQPPNIKGRCWEWQGRLCRGYGYFRLSGKRVFTHRIVWEWNFGAIPLKLFVCHRCDNPRCVRLSHLFLGTPADNTTDMMEKGRHRYIAHYGQDCHYAKLTEADVLEIRRLRQAGVSGKVLAEKFGVHNSTIYHIVKRRNWRHI